MRNVFAPVIEIVRDRLYGPEPVGRAQAVMLQLQTGNALGGRMGTPHFGMKGEACNTFTGLVASPQRFQGAAQMGANSHAHVEDYPALPATEAPAAIPGWLNDWTMTEGMPS